MSNLDSLPYVILKYFNSHIFVFIVYYLRRRRRNSFIVPMFYLISFSPHSELLFYLLVVCQCLYTIEYKLPITIDIVRL